MDSQVVFCAPSGQPTSRPTQPTTQPTIHNWRKSTTLSSGTELNLGEIIGVSVGMAFILLGAALALYMNYARNKKIYSKEKDRKERLNSLPVHKAILEKLSTAAIIKAIQSHPTTLALKDYDEQTAFDVALSSRSTIAFDVLYELLSRMLPINVKSMQKVPPEMHAYAWISIIQYDDNICVEVIEQLLENHNECVEQLAVAIDDRGRLAMDIASSNCKRAIREKLYLAHRYDVQAGRPEHKSATCVLVFARDYHASVCGNAPKVALKFMKNKDQFRCEIEARKIACLDEQFVVGILRVYDGDDSSFENVGFRRDAIRKGFGNYPYCVVMEACDESLKRVIDEQHVAGEDWDQIKHIFREVVTAVGYLHGKGLIHGDLKPNNVMRTGREFKLIDLDAAANFFKNEFAGAKYSSLYSPPEFVFISPMDGLLQLRTFARDPQTGMPIEDCNREFSLVAAHPSYDMWALGALLYFLCVGATLFQGTIEDNIFDDDDLNILVEHNDDIWNSLLAKVKDKYARNLISLLLNNDPALRPLTDRVLSHPFLTGKKPARMNDEIPEWDVFLSYRVESDEEHAKLLYSSMVLKGFKVWWDKTCLQPGERWEEGFIDGLMKSSCFVCLLSRDAINNESKSDQNFSKLEATSKCDNVLLEWRMALELKEQGLINKIFPVMIGNKEHMDNAYSKYFQSGCHPVSPHTVVNSIEDKLHEHFSKQGLGLPLTVNMTVNEIVTRITQNQGGFIQGDWLTSSKLILNGISDMIQQQRRQHKKMSKEDPTRSSNSNCTRTSLTNFKMVSYEDFERDLASSYHQMEKALEGQTKLIQIQRATIEELKKEVLLFTRTSSSTPLRPSIFDTQAVTGRPSNCDILGNMSPKTGDREKWAKKSPIHLGSKERSLKVEQDSDNNDDLTDI